MKTLLTVNVSPMLPWIRIYLYITLSTWVRTAWTDITGHGAARVKYVKEIKWKDGKHRRRSQSTVSDTASVLPRSRLTASLESMSLIKTWRTVGGLPPSWVLSTGIYISCQKYFCRISKFGEDILNHGRTSGRFLVHRFWPWILTLTSQTSTATFGADAEHPRRSVWKSDLYFSRKSLPPPS